MIAPWNRCELATVLSQEECDHLTRALEDAGLDYQVKVIDRASPSALSMGTRERSGVFLQPGSIQYHIYVRQKDREKAREVTGLGPIR